MGDKYALSWMSDMFRQCSRDYKEEIPLFYSIEVIEKHALCFTKGIKRVIVPENRFIVPNIVNGSSRLFKVVKPSYLINEAGKYELVISLHPFPGYSYQENNIIHLVEYSDGWMKSMAPINLPCLYVYQEKPFLGEDYELGSNRQETGVQLNMEKYCNWLSGWLNTECMAIDGFLMVKIDDIDGFVIRLLEKETNEPPFDLFPYRGLDSLSFTHGWNSKELNHLCYCSKNLKGSLVIPEFVVSINNFVFSHLDGLTSVMMPESLQHIGNASFSNCKNLREIYFTTQNIQSCEFGEECFKGVNTHKCVLYVPQQSLSQYLHHHVLGKFKHVIGLSHDEFLEKRKSTIAQVVNIILSQMLLPGQMSDVTNIPTLQIGRNSYQYTK